MKKVVILCTLLLALTGCSEKSYETVSDVYLAPTKTASRLTLALPEDANRVALTNAAAGTAYLCDGYCVTVSTLEAGDLDATLRTTTGFTSTQLPVMERQDGANRRYECVWAAAGEGEDQIGRAVVLDDGSFHYVLTVMADAEDAGDLRATWQRILDSFRISTAP